MPTTRPVVSVIVPCYNQGEFLREALEPLAAQTFRDFEVIVIDDGSTESRTKNILANFQAPGGLRVTLIRQKNTGVSTARNNAIRKARGEFILPLDADDKISANYLELTVKAMRKDKRLGVVSGQTKTFGPEATAWAHPPYSEEVMLFDNAMPPASLFRRADWAKVGGYDTAMRFAEDRDLWLAILELGRKALKIPQATYFYRKHAASVTFVLGRADRSVEVAMVARLMRKHTAFYLKHAEFVARKALGLEGASTKQKLCRPAGRYEKIFSYTKTTTKSHE